MIQKMRPAEFIALSACTMMLTALGIDIMLPVFSKVREHFHLTTRSTETSKIISFFFMGQIAQIIFGTLSDKFGRLAILHIGFPLYIIGGVAATFAPTLPVMLGARFLAGMGASAVFMTTIAGVRDRFVGDQMARTMSLIFTIFLFTPIIAPFLGIAILHLFSWKIVFLTPPAFAVIIFLWSLRLEESHPRDKRSSLNITSIINSIKSVISNKTFLRYVAVTTLLFSSLSSYVASSEHIIGDIYGRPALFPWIFAGIGLVMSLCTFINSKLSIRYGAYRSIRALSVLYTIVAGLLLLFTLITGDPPEMLILFIAIALLLAINITIEPNSSALALEPMGNMAGVASSIYGTIFFFIGATIGSVVSNLMVNNVLPLVICFFAAGIISLLLVLSSKNREG